VDLVVLDGPAALRCLLCVFSARLCVSAVILRLNP